MPNLPLPPGEVVKLIQGRASGRPREGPGFKSRVCDCFQPRFLTRFPRNTRVSGVVFRIARGDLSRCAAHTFKLKLLKEKSPTFLVVHVDSRTRGTTPAAAGGIAEKGSEQAEKKVSFKIS